MSQDEVFLDGSKVQLRLINANDYGSITRWVNDRKVTHYMFYGQKPLTEKQVSDQFEREMSDHNSIIMILIEKKSKLAIGVVGFYEIHQTARKAELRILIGEREAWGKGYGTEAIEMLTYYGFDRLNLNRIWLGVTSENKRALNAYKKAGYQVEGILRQDLYRNSNYYDSIRMAILRTDYYENLFSDQEKRFSISIEKEKTDKGKA